MLYLFTGVPGSGKTLNVVSMLAKRPDLKNRPLFIDGIPDLQIPHEPIPEGESIQTWPKLAPTGAIIVVDECQRIFRPRPSGSKVPEYVSELETHRHRGLDFFFITQHPRLIDANLRSLIEHHTHVSKTELGVRRKLEWSTGGAKNPESRADVRDALKSVYKLDKSVYGLYKSAEEHTKIRTGRSKVFYLIPVVLLMIIGGLWGFYDFWGDFKKTTPTPTAQQEVAAPAASPETGASPKRDARDGAIPRSAANARAAASAATPDRRRLQARHRRPTPHRADIRPIQQSRKDNAISSCLRQKRKPLYMLHRPRHSD